MGETKNMSDSEPSQYVDSGESEVFSLGAIAEGGLPGDLGNAVYPVDYAIQLCKEGIYSEDQLRSALRDAQAFEEYFKGQIEKYNEVRLKKDQQLCDENKSLEAERKRVAPGLIDKFNEKVAELRSIADGEKLDKQAIEKIMQEGITPLLKRKVEQE